MGKPTQHESSLRKLSRSLLAASGFLLAAGVSPLAISAQAQTVWNGAVSKDWNDPANWSSGVPVNSSQTIINSLFPNMPVLNSNTGNETADIYIGSTTVAGTGQGSLTIETTSGDYVYLDTYGSVTVGQGAGSNGTVTVQVVNGPYAAWHIYDSLIVGDNSGTGQLFLLAPDEMNQSYIAGGSGGTFIGRNGGNGTVTIENSLLDAPNLISVGLSGTGTINVMSSGKTWMHSYPNARTDTLVVGSAGGTGTLNISDNGGIAAQDYMFLGSGVGSTATVNLLSGGKLVDLGHSVDPATSAVGAVIGHNGGVATINISGVGTLGYASSAIFQSSMALGSGAGGTGFINVLNGGKLTTTQAQYFDPANPPLTPQPALGVDGGSGSVLVSDPGSAWYVAAMFFGYDQSNDPVGDLSIGYSGTGSVTLANGGLLSVGWIKTDSTDAVVDHAGTGMVYIGEQAGSSGTLNFGAPAGQTPVAPGTLEAAGIQFGAGQGEVSFNHTDGNYRFAVPISGTGTLSGRAGTTWLDADNSGFSGATNLYGGALGLTTNNALGTSFISVKGNGTLIYNDGVTIANNGVIDAGVTLTVQVDGTGTATQAGVFSGAGALTKTGAGTLNLTDFNPYTGETTIAEGVLALIGSNSGSISQSDRVVANGVFDISAGPAQSFIRSLAGSGNVLLGAQNLVVTAGHDTFAGVISGSGGFAVSGGTQALSGANSYTGPTDVSGGTLRAAAANTFSPASIYNVAANGVLDLDGFDQTIAGLANAGTVRLAGEPGTRLRVAGNYIGNGGQVLINTVLGADASPTDRLVVDGGSASGSTRLIVTNIGGGGAQTLGDGIMVVQTLNGATTTPGSFILGNRVAAGAYDYLLFYGGDAEAGGNPNDQNWYLRSTLDDWGPEPVPNIRPEVAVFSSVVPLASEYGFSVLDTLHQRRGDSFIAPQVPVYEARVVRCNDRKQNYRCTVRSAVPSASVAERWAATGWARLLGERGLRRNENFERRGADYSYTFGGLQAGLDIYGRETAAGDSDKTGIYMAYGQITGDVKGAYGGKAGSVDMDAFTIGGYWTHQAAQGWYTDAVVQGTWYSADAKSVMGERAKPDGFGVAVSLEGGYAFRLGSGFTLEPQAQLIYQNVSFDDVSDRFAQFRLDDGETLRGRLGFRLAKSWNAAADEKPRLITGWLRANLWHEFLGKQQTTVTSPVSVASPYLVNSSLRGTWGEIGAGISAQVTDAMTLFTSASYNRSLDNKGREAWDGRIGLNVRW